MMIRIKYFSLLVFMTTILLPTNGQVVLESEFGIYGGAEHNIFKSPDILLDRTTMQPLPEDSILYRDFFADFEYDIELKREGEKFNFSIGSDLWYRNYIEYSDLNQARLSAFSSLEWKLTDKFILGAGYDFRWSDRIGTSVTGDLLMRSFKYFGHTGSVYADMLLSKKFEMSLQADYQYKDYYDERTVDPLVHGNLEASFEMDYELSRDHDFGLALSFIDRHYYEYHSLDQDGHYSDLNPLRHFRYYKGKFDYNWTPIRGLRINPGVELTRREDLYQDYYSYLGVGGSLRLRYFSGKFYVSAYGDYTRVEYDIRPAFTSSPNDPMLVYGYYDLSFTIRYEISARWRVFLKLESDNRTSNTDLEYFVSRRPYKTYQGMIGITFALPDIEF